MEKAKTLEKRTFTVGKRKMDNTDIEESKI